MKDMIINNTNCNKDVNTVKIFESYAEEYDNWYEKNKFAYLSELQTIKQFLPLESRSLEIGIGTGRFAMALKIDFGIDLSLKMLKIAKRRGIDVQLAIGEDIPFKNEVFDNVLIMISLCFVKNPAKVILESRRVLKNGGNIIIGIIDRNSNLGKIYQSKKSKFYKNANFFTVEEVTDLLKRGGFSEFSYRQTLFSYPQKSKKIEMPRPDYGEGGFVVIRAVAKK